MCGIAGVVSLREGAPPPSLADLQSMAGALAHRGPDEFGIYRDARAGLAHARLSIIDLLTGQQPLHGHRDSLWTVFNGEIFNYPELRAELSGLGYRFLTRSDTEVALNAYAAWGDKAFERFNGQFAIAIWDSEQDTLVLARDPHGIQPLYYCEHKGRLWFASEVKAIFAGDPSIRRALDPVGLSETFTFWSVVPPQSVFAGVSELEPGHVRKVSSRGISDRPYYRPHYGRGADRPLASLQDAAMQVRSALEEAVRLRMLRADVPVGSYLSGGLDSSVVAALARRATASRFSTFSIRFEEGEFDESPYQRMLAGMIESDHREVMVKRSDIAAIFPRVVLHAERPVLRTAAAPLFLLSRAVRDAGIKVVLTGEGADEVFAGYDIFREGKIRRFWGRQPASTLRPKLLARLYPYLSRSPVAQQAMAGEFFGRGREQWAAPGFAHQPRWQSTSALQRLLAPDVRAQGGQQDVVERLLATLPEDFGRWHFLEQDQYLESRTLLSGYLLSSQGDRMLMAHSVEGRFPYLDPVVTDLANALPPSYKLHVLDEKHVLKRAAAGLVPQEILARPKQPYRAPDAMSFVDPGAPDWIGDVLAEDALKDAGIFEPTTIARLWHKCRSSRDRQMSNSDNMALCGVLSTQLLHAEFVRRAPERRVPGCIRTTVDLLRPTVNT
jgi:asparagine synthase (glutamine-hydrolysing)